MGLLSGRKNDTGAGVTEPGVTGTHRYETRSRGGLFSNNAGPGATTGAGGTNTVGTGTGGGLFGRKNKGAVPTNTTGTGRGGAGVGTGVGAGAGIGGAGGPGVPANQAAPGSGTPVPKNIF